MRNRSTQVVYDLVRQDKKVLAVTADNRNEIYDKIRTEYPAQYIEYGIAEENMVASCAGLASCGFIPFLYTITNFMSMHAFEFIRNDVCVGNRNVKFLGRSCGLVSSSMGVTHQGIDELGLFRSLPNMIVITPATPIEAQEATLFAYQHDGPVYIRLEGFNEPELFDEMYSFDVGKGSVVRNGSDVTIIAMGSVINEAIAAAEEAMLEGVSVEIIDMPTVKPIDADLIIDRAGKRNAIITLEEHSIYGGLGTAVAEVLATHNIRTRLFFLGLDGFPKGCGNRAHMRNANGLDSQAVYKIVMAAMERK